MLSDKDSASIMNVEQLKKGLSLFYSCEDYWVVNQDVDPGSPEFSMTDSDKTGVAFYTFSYKIAPSYFKYSIVTFYISIVLVIGRVLRGVIVIPGNRFFITEIHTSD